MCSFADFSPTKHLQHSSYTQLDTQHSTSHSLSTGSPPRRQSHWQNLPRNPLRRRLTKRIQTSNDITCKIQIWDTAGAENFRSMSHMFCRGAGAVVVCYDVGSRRSFEVMRGWVDELRMKDAGGKLGVVWYCA
jgi:GTPase SAR1 family protein